MAPLDETVWEGLIRQAQLNPFKTVHPSSCNVRRTFVKGLNMGQGLATKI